MLAEALEVDETENAVECGRGGGGGGYPFGVVPSPFALTMGVPLTWGVTRLDGGLILPCGLSSLRPLALALALAGLVRLW